MTIGTPVVTQPGDSGLLVPKLRKLYADNGAEAAKAFGFPSISVEVTTSTNDSGEVLNLSDYFTFPSNTIIPVKLRHYARTDNDRYFQELDFLIIGSETAGTDPIIVGESALSTGVQGVLKEAFGIVAGAATKYGLVTYKAAIASGATNEVVGQNSHGIAAAAFSSGASTITAPANRTIACLGVNFAAATYAADSGAVPHVEVTDGSTSGTFELADPDDGGLANNPADGVLTALFRITPPVNAFLVLDGTPDPGEVLLHVSGITSDEVKHRVDVFIGEPIDGSFYGDA